MISGLFNGIKEKVTGYIDVHVKLIKLGFVEKTANVFSYFMWALIGLFIVFGIILFIGLGLSEVFASCGFSRGAAYFMTTGVYLLLLLLLLGLRKKITGFFAGSIVQEMTDQGSDEKEND